MMLPSQTVLQPAVIVCSSESYCYLYGEEYSVM